VSNHFSQSFFRDYLELVDWSGRAVRSGKKGAIPENSPPILQRLQLSPEGLARFLAQKQDWPKALGPVDQIRAMAIAAGGRFFKGISTSRLLFAR
jgi:hypothetical protein